MKRDDELVVTLEKFAAEGKSLVRVNGQVLFVKGAVPGDVARVRVNKVKQSFAEGETLEIECPSPVRITPQCRYFGVCGGCKWQNLNYDAQLAYKREHVMEALEHIGGFHGLEVAPALGAADAYYYRNKMEFSFGDRWRTKEELEAGPPPDGDFALGLHVPGRFDRVLDLEECWLQSPTSVAIVNAVRAFAKEHALTVYSSRTFTGYLRNLVIRLGRRTGELMVNLVTTDHSPETMEKLTGVLLEKFPGITTVVNNVTARRSLVAIGDEERCYHGPGWIREQLGNRLYRISANSFFQTNTLQAERLYDAALRMAELRPEDVVFDLYSGTGTIALHLSGLVRQVIGIEAVESAVEDARRNAQENGVENCTFVVGDLKERLTNNTLWMEVRPDVVVVDPPRAGMHPRVVSEIAALAPGRIVYVSCNPATQARDLKLLCAEEKYEVRGVQPVDMFPQTTHIENIVALRRASDVRE
jgi:23S rRNA (uracil1939-C5)-methyltransferase